MTHEASRSCSKAKSAGKSARYISKPTSAMFGERRALLEVDLAVLLNLHE